MINVTENSEIRVLPIRLKNPEFSEDLKKKIAVRAYEIFVRRGRLPNHDVDDWLKAESEVHWEMH
jgi:hypothetical protein